MTTLVMSVREPGKYLGVLRTTGQVFGDRTLCYDMGGCLSARFKHLLDSKDAYEPFAIIAAKSKAVSPLWQPVLQAACLGLSGNVGELLLVCRFVLVSLCAELSFVRDVQYLVNTA